MKVIIAGSRSIQEQTVVYTAIEQSGFMLREIVSGMAKGVDRLGEQYAKAHHLPIKRFPANWVKYGKKAGYIRNAEMADYADALIAVWDGQSRGTQHMVKLAELKNLPIFVYHYR
jgi:hypothetical protein